MLSRVYYFLSAQKRRRVEHPLSDSLAALLQKETQALIDENPDLFQIGKGLVRHAGEGEKRWFEFVNTLSNRVMIHFGNHLLDHLSGANVFNIFHTLGSAGGLTTLLAPYFVAFSEFTKGRDLGRQVLKRFGHSDTEVMKAGEVKLAHFTDTFYEVNGVALTIQQQVRMAVDNNFGYTVITCDDENRPQEEGVRHFSPIGTYQLPEYEMQKIFYPPFLEMLRYCHREQFNHIHTATPGPVGLAALAISKFLQVPISGTYHTSIPQYVQVLTGSDFMEELAWKFVLWYYDQMDLIYAPSNSTRDELISKGIDAEKVLVYPRGIDIERFSPDNRNGFYKQWSADDETVKLVYVGRVSKEKNLHLLLEAYRNLVQKTRNVVLTIVGDGPYLEEMKSQAADLPCIFTGALSGDALTAAYASSDLFVFPSTTDTFGNVVLEAQASGIPVIVTDQGGPCENILNGETGIVIQGDSTSALFSAMEQMVTNPERLAEMGKAARNAMESRSFEAAFSQTWETFGRVNADKLAVAV
jgi:glycosyltransferase involved in cell wall biosynthesis